MIVYLDASALVKRYVAERGSQEVGKLAKEASVLATSIITRAEVAAAIQRAARMELVDLAEAQKAVLAFRSEWENFQRLPVHETTVGRADHLTSQYDLRGYDAVHLASATLWQEALGEDLHLATYDRLLAKAAQQSGLQIWP
jgi:predicted nucleic acid-binding protein